MSSTLADGGAEQAPTAKRARTSGSKAAMTTKTSKASAAKSTRSTKATATKSTAKTATAKKSTATTAKTRTTAAKKATTAKTAVKTTAKSTAKTAAKSTAKTAAKSTAKTATKPKATAKAGAKATKSKTATAKTATKTSATKTKSASAEPKKATTIKRAGGGKKAALSTPSAVAAPRDPADALARAQELGHDITLPELVQVGREVLGIEELRPGQGEALEHILAGRDVLAVMPTGSGKSLLYQLPSLALPGLTVVVSPLIALIKDQIDKMTARGVAVVRIDSTLTVKQRREMDALARAPGGKLLLTTPERMADPEFREMLRESAEGVGVSLFVVDEAHCVSQWGHDFRPSYLTLRKSIEDLGRPPILATTATAPPHVREDILHQLGTPDAEVVTTTFDRPNLHYECIALPGDDDKNKTLVTLLKRLPRPGIVYCATVKKVEELAESLARHGIPVARYHGRLTKKERDANQNAFMAAKDLVMIATNAFGLGVDKPDIRYVLHYHVPGSLEAYAQEAGRGGRDGKPARCVLLFSPDDVAIQEYFLTGTYPSRRQVRAVYKTLEAWSSHDEAQPTVANLAVSSHVGAQRTRTVLSLLKDEGFVVEHEGGLFELADPPPDDKLLSEKAKQYEARRVADRQRLDALLDYVGAAGCRSQAILSYLGEDDTPECGRCDNCLRSRDAAIAAAREAARLEDGVIRRLTAEDEEADEVPRSKRLVRTRLIRIDDPAALAQIEAQESAAAAAASQSGEAPVRNGQSRKSPNELAALIAEQEADDARAWQKEAPPAADEYDDDDDEYEDEELADDEEYEDDDEYEYVDDDEEYEDDDEYVIDKTAAALAEEGYAPEETEITILARKKVAKPAKQPTRPALEEPKKPRKRRRRRKKNVLPSKDSFTSPVLTKEQAPPPNREQRRRRGAAPAGPLVEYVRGPLRINMTPVASATPNDVARRKNGNFKFKKRRRPAGGDELPMGVRPAPAPPSVTSEEPGKKKRRRRRRKKRRGPGQTMEGGGEAPIDFFSSSADPSPTGKKRRKRRRRRRGGSGKAPGPGGGGAPAGE